MKKKEESPKRYVLNVVPMKVSPTNLAVMDFPKEGEWKASRRVSSKKRR